jgi:hypothetical protein
MGESCVPASLNSNLGDAAVLLFSVSCPGCAYFGLQVKAINWILPCLCPVVIGFNLLPTALQAGLGKKRDPISKITRAKRHAGRAQVVEHLPGKCEKKKQNKE